MLPVHNIKVPVFQFQAKDAFPVVTQQGVCRIAHAEENGSREVNATRSKFAFQPVHTGGRRLSLVPGFRPRITTRHEVLIDKGTCVNHTDKDARSFSQRRRLDHWDCVDIFGHQFVTFLPC